jgi:hemolysin III
MSSLTIPAAFRQRRFSAAEEAVHSITHGAGAVLAVPAIVALAAAAQRRGDALAAAGSLAFGASLLVMLGVSSTFHGLRESRAKRIMETVDNDAVYVLIAGTYTAYCLASLRSGSGWLLLGVVWALAAVGIAVRTLFPGRFRLAALSCYLAMGWLIAPFFGEIRAAVPERAFALLVAGGISYSVGAATYALERVPWLHAAWHLFVLGGAACHFFSILDLMRC